MSLRLKHLTTENNTSDGCGLERKEVAILPEGKSLSIMMTPALQEEINKIAQSINSTQEIGFGKDVQNDVVNIANAIVASTKVKDLGDIGELLAKARVNMQTVKKQSQQNRLQKKFSSAKAHIQLQFENHKKIEDIMKATEQQIENYKQLMEKEIKNQETLGNSAMQAYQKTCIYILAGQSVLTEMKAQYENKYQEYGQTSDIALKQELNNEWNTIIRWERKIESLIKSAYLSINLMAETKDLQQNSQNLWDILHNQATIDLPTLRGQLALALGINNQQQVLAFTHLVGETTKNVIAHNSETLKQGSSAIARGVEETLVSEKVLLQIMNDRIETLKTREEIVQQAREQRKQTQILLQEKVAEYVSTLNTISQPHTLNQNP